MAYKKAEDCIPLPAGENVAEGGTKARNEGDIMRRLSFALLATVGVCPIVGLSMDTAAQAQEDAGGVLKGRLVLKRKVDFLVKNSTAEKGSVPRVSGKGVFPVRLAVRDQGQSLKPRRLQVVICVFAQVKPQRLHVGERFFIRTDPRVLTTAPDNKDQDVPFELDVPMPPGDYVAHVFLCDPDRPYILPALPSFPTADEVPGAIMKGSAFFVHVDPSDAPARDASKI